MNTDRTFLARVLPWAGNPGAWFNLHFTTDKKHWNARAYKTIDEMMRGLAWVKQQAWVRDVYVCMSSQATSTQKISATGLAYRWGERSGNNAVELKSLFLDVDVKPSAYATPEEAIAAFQAFMTAAGLPRPTMFVFSGGGGFHCHWILDRGLTPGEWLPLAKALKAATKQHGLKTDEGVTADAARILRIPETTNYKYAHKPLAHLGGSVLPADYPVDDIAKILAPYMTAAPAPIVTSGVKSSGSGGAIHAPPAPSLNSDLSAGVGDRPFDFVEFRDATEFLTVKGAFDRTKHDEITLFTHACCWVEVTLPHLANDIRGLFKDTIDAIPDRDPEHNARTYERELARTRDKLGKGETVRTPKSIFKMAYEAKWAGPAGPGASAPSGSDAELARRLALEYGRGGLVDKRRAAKRAAQFAGGLNGCVYQGVVADVGAIMTLDRWEPEKVLAVAEYLGLPRTDAAKVVRRVKRLGHMNHKGAS